jgi:hypothetical protein
VTRLGEFSSIGRYFTYFEHFFFKIVYSSPHFFASFSMVPRQCIYFDTQLAWLHFGRFFRKLIWGRCNDYNFLRFSTIFGEKMAFFSKTNVMIKILQNLAFLWVKNANFFNEFFGENISKIITSVPGHAAIVCLSWTYIMFVDLEMGKIRTLS